MNAADILKYGHRTVIKAVEGLEEDDWYVPGVCGAWSCKDIIAHLGSTEYLLAEALSTLIDPDAAIPYMQKYGQHGRAFNDLEVDARKDRSAAEVLEEYKTVSEQSMQILTQVPLEKLRTTGIFPWYGAQYDPEGFIVYAFYGHKREHSAQIEHFRTNREINHGS